jgi:ribosomal-protein-alanine N-acetyltransferase
MDELYALRPMQREDLAMVSLLDQLSFTEPWPKNTFAYELTTNYSICQVAVEQSGNVVGAIVVWLVVDEAHVATIAVHPDHRQKGIGAALLATALLIASYRGATSSLLEVRVSNLAAIKLYERFGYKTDGVRRNYYQDNQEDALLMTLPNLDRDILRNFLPPNCVSMDMMR